MALLIYWDINLQRGAIKWDSMSGSRVLLWKNSLCSQKCAVRSQSLWTTPPALISTVAAYFCLPISLYGEQWLTSHSITTDNVGLLTSSKRNLPFQNNYFFSCYWGSTAIFQNNTRLLEFLKAITLSTAWCSLGLLHKALEVRIRNPRKIEAHLDVTVLLYDCKPSFSSFSPKQQTEGSPKSDFLTPQTILFFPEFIEYLLPANTGHDAGMFAWSFLVLNIQWVAKKYHQPDLLYDVLQNLHQVWQ